jgi:4-amino-4-deoxy-L-arabinose transferase-like glycosyltransferase
VTVAFHPALRLLRPAEISRRNRLRQRLATHRTSALVVAALVVVVGLAHGVNFDGYPFRLNDDEGTYAAQAMAFLHDGRLSHYTYWYDHPPFGWMTIAAYAGLTGGFDRTPTVVSMVREVMLLADLVTSALLFVLMRRLHFSRWTASVAVLAFGLSPLSVYFHRLGFLDNLEMVWVSLAMVLAASPRRSLGSVFGSAVCFAAAVLTKETAGVLLPALLWLLLQQHGPGSRGWALGVFLPTFFGISFAYPLYAILKNELLEGPGHVSLLWALRWQLVSRQSTGSVLDTGSVTYAMVGSWLDTDRWLLLGGALVLPAGLCIRPLRPFAVALAVQIALMCRGGYLPQAFVIALLPFSALLIAGVGEVVWTSRLTRTVPARASRWWRWGTRAAGRTGVAVVTAGILVFAVWGAPGWASGLRIAATQKPSTYSLQATEWIKHNIPRHTTIVVDDNVWGDLKLAGYTNQIWLYKIDLDPEVNRTLLPNGYRDIRYVILLQLSPDMLKGMPTLQEAIEHSRIVTAFGEGRARLIVREVDR